MTCWIDKGNAKILMLGFVVPALTGCTRPVQAWPPPLATGTTVTVRFTQPRVIVFHDASKPDSVTGVKALRGPVVRLNHDTLVVIVLKEWNALTQKPRLPGQEVQVPLDQSTVVTGSEIDGWKFAYALLAGAVLIFVGIVMSGS
jgi:hypothetical protein